MLSPPISKELLEFLDKLYPLRSPKMDETERSIFARAGQRQVIDTLRKYHEAQVKASLEGRLLAGE